MPRPNIWRDTARTTRFWIFDALAAVPLVFSFLYLRTWTFALALASFVVFGVLERIFGFSLRVALRRLRAKVAGRVRYGMAWWHKHQDRIE